MLGEVRRNGRCRNDPHGTPMRERMCDVLWLCSRRPVVLIAVLSVGRFAKESVGEIFEL